MVKIKFSQEYVSFERADYTVLAFLGDTGALFDVLLKIGAAILGFTGLLDITLTNFLLLHIFEPTENKNSVIGYCLAVVFCDVCKQKKIRQQNRIALRRIDREIDILQFVHKQFYFSALVHALTTKNERALARKNYRYKLEGSASSTEESSAVELADIKVRTVVENTLAKQMDKPRNHKKVAPPPIPDVTTTPVRLFDEEAFEEKHTRILAKLKTSTKKLVLETSRTLNDR